MGKFVSGLIIVLLLAIFVVATVMVLPDYEKCKSVEQELWVLNQKLDSRKQQCEALRVQIHDLECSSSAIEKVARERYGLSREGEQIYRYEND